MFLTCKIPSKSTSTRVVRDALRSSLASLGRASCDLLLLHWPAQALEAGSLREVWAAMEEARREGECAELGVSNFTVAALRALGAVCSTPPCVNQVNLP